MSLLSSLAERAEFSRANCGTWEGDIHSPPRRFADVAVVSGINTPLAQSTMDWSQFQPQEMQNTQAPTPLMPSADAQVAQPSMQR